MADFECVKSDRFEGDFCLRPVGSYSPTSDEQIYLDRLNELLGKFSTLVSGDDPVSDELKALLKQCSEKLYLKADVFSKASVGEDRDKNARKQRDYTFRIQGIHSDRRDRILEIPFVIRTCPAIDGKERPINDIIIMTRDVPIPQDKQEFKVEIDRTLLVLKSVLLAKRRHWIVRFLQKTRGLEDSIGSNTADVRLDEYLYALAGIARVGLMNLDKTQTPFAKLALVGFKDEFVAREAGKVKNGYVRKLGINAFLALLSSVVVYILARWTSLGSEYSQYRNFLLLWAGAAVGTWLSFSIRRVVLGFSDLATLEEDRLNPGVRILFMIALTTVIGLLFWTKAVQINIGSFGSDFSGSGAGPTAFLIGALCGIAERSMTSAVAKRAEEFAIGVGRAGANQEQT